MANPKFELNPKKVQLWLKIHPLNKECYFCGYNKLVELHHIKPKSKQGTNYYQNILPLCPNCHSLIHKKNYEIIYMFGFYILKCKTYDYFIFPTEKQLMGNSRQNDELDNNEEYLKKDLI